jgi:DNA-binding beta-propeller fold protein YncE
MKRYVFLLSVFFFLPVSVARAFTLSNFDTPESFVVDPEDGSYYVSNVNGNPTEKDGNGYISKINPKGDIIIQKFIGGKKDALVLHAPKGLCVVGGTLYVADIDTVKAFNKKTRKPAAIVDLSKFGVRFLNDVAADKSGNLYVSDTMTNRIFRIDSGNDYQVSVYAQGPELGSPSGLIVNPRSRNLIAVTWETGRVLEIAKDRILILKRGLTALDGVDYDTEGRLYVSSFEKGEIYRIANYGRGRIETYLNGLTTPADISYDRRANELLVPSFKGHNILTVPRKSD